MKFARNEGASEAGAKPAPEAPEYGWLAVLIDVFQSPPVSTKSVTMKGPRRHRAVHAHIVAGPPSIAACDGFTFGSRCRISAAVPATIGELNHVSEVAA